MQAEADQQLLVGLVENIFLFHNQQVIQTWDYKLISLLQTLLRFKLIDWFFQHHFEETPLVAC